MDITLSQNEDYTGNWHADGSGGRSMKQIEVVAAIIRKGDKIFATQRGYGEWKDWWEFPGGKMEAGETPEEALKREIREELSTEISVDEFLCTVEYDYPNFHLTMHCYLCSLVTEALHLNEHEAAKWLTKDELDSGEVAASGFGGGREYYCAFSINLTIGRD